MLDTSGRYRDAGLLLLRVGLGLCMICHGVPKLAGGPETWKFLGGAMGLLGIRLWPVAWGFLAGVAEALGGALLLTGILFRPACVVLVFQMFVAIIFHLNSSDATTRSFSRGYSHALELGVVFIALALMGPGKYRLAGRRQRRTL